MDVLSVGWETSALMAGGLGVHYSRLSSGLSGLVSLSHILPFESGLPNSTHLPFASSASFLSAVLDYNSRLAAMPPPGCDLLHAHDWLASLGSARLARKSGIPLVLSVHSTVFDREFMPSPGIYSIERRAFRSADRIIAVSSMLKDTIASRYGIPAEKISVIPNGFSPSGAKPSEPEAPLVLFSGRLVFQKSPESLVLAIPKVLSFFPDARFVFCGMGYLRPALESFAGSLGVSGSLSFQGFVPYSEIFSYYSNSSLLVSSSVSEPFGLSILEALGSGLPCVVTPNTGLLEFCDAPVVAERASDSIAEAISSLLADTSLRRRLSRKGKRQALSLPWEDIASRTVSVYESALGS